MIGVIYLSAEHQVHLNEVLVISNSPLVPGLDAEQSVFNLKNG